MVSLVWSVKPTLVPEVGKPGIDLERVVNLAVDEFINSRPWPFRKLAKWGCEKGRKDIVLVTKNAVTFAQITFAFLIIQYCRPVGQYETLALVPTGRCRVIAGRFAADYSSGSTTCGWRIRLRLACSDLIDRSIEQWRSNLEGQFETLRRDKIVRSDALTDEDKAIHPSSSNLVYLTILEIVAPIGVRQPWKHKPWQTLAIASAPLQS